MENKQKLVQLQKRMRFLWLLKSATATIQEQAGAPIGWKLRQSNKDLGVISGGWREQSVAQERQLANGQVVTGTARRVKRGFSSARRSIKFDVSYMVGAVSDLCQRLKIKLKTARPVNLKKDEAQVLLQIKKL